MKALIRQLYGCQLPGPRSACSPRSGSPVRIVSWMPDCLPGATPVLFADLEQLYMVVTRRATTMQADPYSMGFGAETPYAPPPGGSCAFNELRCWCAPMRWHRMPPPRAAPVPRRPRGREWPPMSDTALIGADDKNAVSMSATPTPST
jgi:hypothetical protein